MTLLNFKLYNNNNMFLFKKLYLIIPITLYPLILETMIPQFQYYTSSGYVYFKKFVSGKYTEKYDAPICLW